MSLHKLSHDVILVVCDSVNFFSHEYLFTYCLEQSAVRSKYEFIYSRT